MSDSLVVGQITFSPEWKKKLDRLAEMLTCFKCFEIFDVKVGHKCSKDK